MLGAVKNLLHSEKAVAVGALVVGSTVLAALGKISPVEWMGYTETLAGIYVGGKAIQGVGSAVVRAKEVSAQNEQLKAQIAASDKTANAAVAEKFSGEATSGQGTRYAATPEG